MRTPTSQRGFTFVELVMFIVIVGVALSAISMLFVQNVRYSADPLIRQKSIAVAKAYMDEIVRKKWDELTPDGGGCIDTSAASNCAPTWATNTKYEVGQRVQPSTFNSHVYEATVAGRSDLTTEPTWPTGGGTVVDGSVTWQDLRAPTIGTDAGELRWQFDDVDDYNALSATPDSPPQFPDSTDLVDGKKPMPGYDGFSVTVSVSHPGTATWAGINKEDVKKIDLSVDAPNGETMTFTLYRVNY